MAEIDSSNQIGVKTNLVREEKNRLGKQPTEKASKIIDRSFNLEMDKANQNEEELEDYEEQETNQNAAQIEQEDESEQNGEKENFGNLGKIFETPLQSTNSARRQQHLNQTQMPIYSQASMPQAQNPTQFPNFNGSPLQSMPSQNFPNQYPAHSGPPGMYYYPPPCYPQFMPMPQTFPLQPWTGAQQPLMPNQLIPSYPPVMQNPYVNSQAYTPSHWQKENSGLAQNMNTQRTPESRNSENLTIQAIQSLDNFSYAMALQTLPELKGNIGNDSVKSFFKQFCAITDNWPEERKLKALASKCSGRAERAFNTAVATNPYRFDSIRRAMLQHLEDTDAKQSGAFDELMNGIKRKIGESLNDYHYDEYSIKHLIRSIGNSDLALTLELAKKPGMTFDEFVAMASRAEITQQAAKKAEQKQNWRPPQLSNFRQEYRPPRQDWSSGPQNQSQSINCYNCGQQGHLSRNCPKKREQTFQSPRNNFATSANQTPIQNKFQPPEKPNNQRNFLKQNYLVEQTEKPREEENSELIAGGISIDPAQTKSLFENKCDKSENDLKIPAPVGKIMRIKVKILGEEAKAMLDSGAQISLISTPFLHKLIESELGEKKLVFTHAANEVVDINGKKVEYFGVVSLPITRGDRTIWISAHATNASFGFDLLFGTNSLNELGTPEWDGKEILAYSLENPQSKQTFQVEPTLNIGKEGKIVVPITNFSNVTTKLEAGSEIGFVEKVEDWEEAEDFLSAKFSCYFQNEECEENKEREQKVEESCEKNIGKISEEKKRELKKIAVEFNEIFALSDEELQQTNIVEHKIDTGEAKPVKGKLRQVPYTYREKVAKMLQDYLGRGLIRPSISPWASPIVLVPKRDGSLRFCVDYRGLNSVTTKDAFPLPNIDQILLNLNGKKFFSTLDFHSGYWQIKMDRSSIEKTAFLTEFGLHEFVVMPFGLSNAVATFQRFMSRLFEDFINKFIFVYIDDILIASTTFEEHCEHLRLVFEKIREAELKLRIEKCKFAANELAFLGHILTQEGVKMDADKYKPIIELPIPNTKKRLHSFLGFAAYYRKFIYNFATITAPLFHLIKEGTPFKMGEKEIKIVEFLKEKIREDVLLYFPDFEAALKNLNRPFIIFTDASKTGISAILCQPDTEKRIRPIYFASRQCNKHESRYCATELEALAVRFGAKKFSQFIIGIPTRVITDHKALVPMFRKKDETGNARVDRWLMELNARFQLTVEYQPGKTNTVADFLSRTYSEEYSWGEKEIEEKSLEDPPPILSKTHKIVGLLTEREEKEIWVEATKQSELKEVYEFLKERRLPNELREKQKLLDNLHKYSLIEELLYLCEEKTQNLRLFVPQKFRKKTIDFLESEDVPVNKETESTNKIEWTTACEGEKHDLCQTLHCSDLDPVLDSSSELGSTVIRTPLQALLTTFLLLSDQTSSSSAAKELVKQILKEEPGQEIEVYERGRKDYVKGGAFPKENDAEKIWKIWVERCSELRQQMQKSGFNAIELEAPKEVENLKEGEKEGWQNLFATAPWILEKVRAQSMHNATKFITTPRAIIGDSSAKQLVDRMPLTHFIGTEKGPISHIIRELSSCVFSSKVKAAIIFLGRDSLLSSETVDLIMEQCERVQKICCRFTHIKWIWIPPPFIRQHSEQYQALLSRLRNSWENYLFV
uniref:RNA-directed DNA polymerase n=1 Tax=Meloidogyne hapla TaxID=6305 RepID=A0A1I8BSQ3_MELHA